MGRELTKTCERVEVALLLLLLGALLLVMLRCAPWRDELPGLGWGKARLPREYVMCEGEYILNNMLP